MELSVYQAHARIKRFFLNKKTNLLSSSEQFILEISNLKNNNPFILEIFGKMSRHVREIQKRSEGRGAIFIIK